MDYENVKSLLGGDFKEGMTSEEILGALNSKKLADLSTGQYVVKGKFDEISNKNKTLEAQISDLEKAKMTEDEKKIKEQEEKDKLIQTLMADNSKTKAEKVLVSAGLSETEYSKILDKLVEANPTKASEVANEVKDIISLVSKKVEDRLNQDLLRNLGNPANGDKNKKSDEQNLAKTILNNFSSNASSQEVKFNKN
jgi:hypothetical protein